MNTMLKRTAMLALALLALAGWMILSPDRAMADRYGNIEYEIKNGSCEIIKYFGSSSNVIIPISFGRAKVTSIREEAFINCNSIRSITIPYGVTSIGDSAFYKCSNLSSITIPDSVTTIGEFAFAGCSSLISIVIPDSVTTIGKNAFAGCSSLTSFTIPDSLTTIGDGAFWNCSSLTSIVIPDRVTTIGEYTFWECSSLTSITIPDSVITIGDCAFEGCSSLISIEIPNSVTTIGNGAFVDCSSLTSIVIPDSVTTIGSAAFGRCSSLTSIVIPDSVTRIEDLAFSYTASLKEIFIPDSVTDFGKANEALGLIGYDDITESSDGIIIYANCGSAAAKNLRDEGYISSGQAKLIHDPVLNKSYDATCTEDGWKGSTTCSRCEEVVEAAQVIPALGHDPVVDPAVPATMTATGLTEGSHCRRCGEILVEQQMVTKLDTVTSIRFTKNVYRVRVNKTVMLYADINMQSGATLVNQGVTFTSDNPSVIEVDEYGVATALKHGHATITATAENGVTATCLVKTWFF